MHVIDNTSFGSDGTKVSDVNQDGYEDIICGWEQGGIARLYIHPIQGDRWSYVELKAPAVEDALFADLDGDGSQDIVTFSEGKHKRITFHWGPENSDYLSSEKWESEDVPSTINITQWMFGRPMNVDNKNGIDLIVGSKNEGALVGWLESPENPRDVSAWKLHTIKEAGWIMSIEIIDIDSDGLEDVLISDRYGQNNGLKWFKHPGFVKDKLHSDWEENVIGMQGQEPMFLDVLDQHPEGLLDIWVPDRTENLFHFNLIEKAGSNWQMEMVPYPDEAGAKGKSVALGDLNGDDMLDLVTSYADAKDKSGVMWATFNRHDNAWTHYDVSGHKGVKYDFVYLIDMDKDGDLDILTSEENNNSETDAGLGVIWYENVLNRKVEEDEPNEMIRH